MNSQPKLRITTYKKVPLQPSRSQLGPSRGDYALNIILFSANKKLKPLQQSIKKLNTNSDILIIKASDVDNLGYALNNCKLGVRTLCICDTVLNEEIGRKILENQDLGKNRGNFGFVFYVQAVEDVKNYWFHVPGVVIGCDLGKIEHIVEQEYDRVRVKLGEYGSTSTIVSKDQDLMNIKLQIQNSPNKNVIKGDKSKDQIEFYQDNGVPGVGEYNLDTKKKQAHNAVFGTSKR